MPEANTSYEADLNSGATAAETPEPQKGQSRSRTKTEGVAKTYPQFNEDGTPLLGEDGQQVWGETKMSKPKKPKKEKVAKVIEYELNEDGTQKLGEDGQPIPVKKTRAAAVKRVPSNEASVINVDEEQVKKLAKYTGARAQYAAMLKGGQTIAEYLLAGGDKGFLRFYVRDGACTITEFVPTEHAAVQ
jgi:hypothetical protein